MSNTLIIAGAGISACQYNWPNDHPIMAVSSGFRDVPRMDFFCTLDKVMCFPQWLTDSTRWIKHVPSWDCAREWSKLPNVVIHDYVELVEPNFTCEGPIAAGGLKKSNVDGTWHNSLLFAVQVAPRLGFNRVEFIGVDLLGERIVVSDQLRAWHRKAQAAGIEWVNLSPLSSLCEWMPTQEAVLQCAS